MVIVLQRWRLVVHEPLMYLFDELGRNAAVILIFDGWLGGPVCVCACVGGPLYNDHRYWSWHDESRHDQQPRHDRQVWDEGVHGGAAGRCRHIDDWSVWRRLLLGVPGRRPSHRQEQEQRRRAIRLGVGGRRQLHRATGHNRQAAILCFLK